MTLIGLDLGTSFIKGGILDLENLELSHIQRIPFPDPIPGLHPLYREFDPNEIMVRVRKVLADLTPFAGDCEGVVMCSQMHCTIFTTEQGEPQSPMRNWQDQRVLMPHPSGKGTYYDVMASQILPDELRQMGNELRPGLPIGLLYWMVERGELPDSSLVMASLPDFVIANLCGSIPQIEASHALSHGAFNLETMDWHHAVIERLGIGGARWPEIRPQGSVVGTLKLGSKEVPCFTPVGDYQTAIVGALLSPTEMSLNISTGSQVSMLTSGPKFGNFQTRPFFDGRFTATITHIPAGRSLNALVKLFSELAEAHGGELADPWPYIAQKATEAGPTELKVNLAFYNSAIGNYGGITDMREAEMTVGHIFRATCQHMAENYLACARRVSPDQAWSGIVFSGGLAQKIDILRQLICEKFAAPYRVCPSPEDTLFGLMAIGLAFTGRVPSVEQAMTTLLEATNRSAQQ